MFTRKFWRDAAERSVATFAQAFIGVGAVDWTVQGINGIKPYIVAGIAAAVAAIAKALVASKFGDPESASLVDAKIQGE